MSVQLTVAEPPACYAALRTVAGTITATRLPSTL